MYLIDRLTDELGWPRLDTMEALDAWIMRPDTHCLFVPGNPQKNLESGDVAVILPEVAACFDGAFDCAVVADAIERSVRERFDTWTTPSLIFLRDGAVLGAIPKVRDWDDYLERTRLILSGQATKAA